MLEEKGFILVDWFLAGWAYLFSKTPVVTPRDAQRLKLQADYSAPAIVQAWKELGFHVVPIASTEVLAALQSDLVENGLWIHSVSPQAEAEWERLMSEGSALITGRLVSPDMISEVKLHLEVYRQQ